METLHCPRCWYGAIVRVFFLLTGLRFPSTVTLKPAHKTWEGGGETHSDYVRKVYANAKQIQGQDMT